MRVIAGNYKGFKIQSLPGNSIRPTPSKIREAIFDIIGTRIVKADFLDLFAGTGAIGIEAISRGANNTTFVDVDIRSVKLIKNNLQNIHKNNLHTIIRNNSSQAIKYFSNYQNKFDIIFLDPPYFKNYYLKTLQEIDNNNIVNDDGLIIVQHSVNVDVKYDFKKFIFFKEKKYGNTKITIFLYNL